MPLIRGDTIVYNAFKNKFEPIQFNDANKTISYKTKQQQRFKQLTKTKRIKPIEMFVETLVVTDVTIYEDHKRFTNSNNQKIIFHHMKMYFSHYINGIDKMYQNSFQNDPDLRISIKLKNFLFLTVKKKS
jgi:hypothetical protein